MGRRFLSLALCLALSFASLGCGSSEVTGPTRSEAAGVSPTAQPVRAREPAGGGWTRTFEPGRATDELPPPPGPILIEEPVPTQPEPTQPERERDLGDELRQAIGGIEGCLDVQTAAALRGSLSVGVSATVLPSGRLQRASVSAASLPDAARACIRSRAEATSLQTPIDGAPRTVSTTLRFEVSASVTTETRTRPAHNDVLPGAQAPGTTLPALGSTGPAPGAQAPGVTLPALAPSGPAPGAVPPGLTLPAQGPTPRR